MNCTPYIPKRVFEDNEPDIIKQEKCSCEKSLKPKNNYKLSIFIIIMLIIILKMSNNII